MYGSGTERRADERPRPHARGRPRPWATVALHGCGPRAPCGRAPPSPRPWATAPVGGCRLDTALSLQDKTMNCLRMIRQCIVLVDQDNLLFVQDKTMNCLRMTRECIVLVDQDNLLFVTDIKRF